MSRLEKVARAESQRIEYPVHNTIVLRRIYWRQHFPGRSYASESSILVYEDIIEIVR